MADIVGDSSGFLSTHHLPREPLWVSGSQAYASLAKAEAGGVVGLDSAHPRYFISAWFIKSSIELAAQETSGDAAVLIPLWRHLFNFFNPKNPLRSVVEKRFAAGGQSIDLAVVPFEETPLLANESAPDFKPLGIWPVRETSGITAGWYAEDSTFRSFIRTKPDDWRCINTPSHSNADPDHNKCRTCGKALMP